MSRWQSNSLSHVIAELETGKRPRGGAVDFGIPSFGGEHIGSDGELRYEGMKYVSADFYADMRKGKIRAGDILIVKDVATTGKVAQVPNDFIFEEAVVNEHVFIVRVKENLVDSVFAFYFLISPIGNRQILSDFRGAAQGGISRQFVSKVMIPLPPLPEQHRIVDILNHANSIRRLRREALEKARVLIPALFVQMFGDPATNPRGWPITSVGELVTAADYGTSHKASEKRIGVPVLRMGNVTFSGDLALDDLKYVKLSHQDLEKYRLQAGDILFNRTNSKELVGKTGMWDGRFEAVPASYFIRLRVNPSLISPHYVWAFFNTRFMKRRLIETARGAIGQSNINAKEVKAFPIPLSPLSLQDAFTERVADIRALIDQQERQLAKADEMMNALMARFFGNGAGMEAAA